MELVWVDDNIMFPELFKLDETIYMIMMAYQASYSNDNFTS